MVTYADRPWIKRYDPGVPDSLTYPDKPLHAFLQESAAAAPDRVALVTPAKIPLLGYQQQAVTYGELNSLSDALAAALVDMGLKKGDRVAIVMPNSVAFAVVYFGVLKAGGVVAATNPTYPPLRMQYQINDCDAVFVFTLSLFYNTIKSVQSGTKAKHIVVANIKEYLPPLARTLFSLLREKKDGHYLDSLQAGDYWLQDLLTRYAGQKANVSVDANDLGLFQYTGGTTGVSKAACLTHGALVANLMQIQAWSAPLLDNPNGPIGLIRRAELLYLGAIPMFHVYGLVVLLSQAVASGSKIVLVANPRDIDGLVDIIAHYRPNVFLGVPALFNAVVNHPRVKSGAVRLDCFLISTSGAAPLPPATKREYEAAGARRLNEAYGMSETSAASHSNPLVGENRPGSVGLPLPDVACRVVSLDDGETDVPVGEVGELLMSGPNIMRGYHGMPTETANALREKDGKTWLYTGDIVRMDEDGYFYIVDRKKDMALIGGFNVYPNNVEKVIKDHPAVLEVGVAAIPHPEKTGQEALKAWVVVKPGMTVTPEELIKHCETQLARYEIPTRFAFVAELPKSAVGKTLRRELVQMEISQAEQDS
ncbi:MAG: AMP-binding protein [Aggregatilineales bacterium]